MVSVDYRQRLCRCHFGRRRHHIRVDGWWLIAPCQFSSDPVAPILTLQKARIRNEDVDKRVSHTWASAPSPFQPFHEHLWHIVANDHDAPHAFLPLRPFFVSFNVANPVLNQTSVPRPLIADGSQICSVIASAPGRDECNDSSCNAQTDDDPHRIHDPSRLSATATLVLTSTPFVPTS
jgi:hypothetical protein